MSRENKEALLARIAETRGSLERDLAGLTGLLDVPARVRSSFREHPIAWIGGGVALGAVVSTLFRRGGGAGAGGSWRAMLVAALGYFGNQLLSLSLPAIKDLAETELSRWIERRRSPLPRPEPDEET